jgi:hypothetical protein
MLSIIMKYTSLIDGLKKKKNQTIFLLISFIFYFPASSFVHVPVFNRK